MDNNTIIIKNFNLGCFRRLMEQSLLVDNQLVIEFTNKMIKSCSLTSSKSLIKLWTIPLQNLIINPEKIESVESLDTPVNEEQDFSKMPDFNFFVLRGDLFKKYLSVHNSDLVEMEFSIKEINEIHQATTIKITGKSENNSPLITSFVLTSEEMITVKRSDFANIISMCTPEEDMLQIILNAEQVQEIKRLIKNLHKSISDNSAYLTFTIVGKKIIVNDKVFSIDFVLDEDLIKNIDFQESESFSFNILKSDFIVTGNHILKFFTKENSQRVILSTMYSGALIQCLVTKITQQNIVLSEREIEKIDGTDLTEYGIDSLELGKDLPF